MWIYDGDYFLFVIGDVVDYAFGRGERIVVLRYVLFFIGVFDVELKYVIWYVICVEIGVDFFDVVFVVIVLLVLMIVEWK